MLEVSVADCAAAIFIPQFQSYKIRNSIADGEMTHGQMKDWRWVFLPGFEKLSLSIIDKVSKMCKLWKSVIRSKLRGHIPLSLLKAVNVRLRFLNRDRNPTHKNGVDKSLSFLYGLIGKTKKRRDT
jgi:hypothetical protein